MKKFRAPNTPLGPDPAPTTTVSLTAAQQVVLEALASAGEAGIQELSKTTGLHGNTVREHLGALVKAGLVRQQLARPQGRGRPSTRYEPVPLPRASTELAMALATELAAAAPDPAAAAVRAGRVWAEREAAGSPRAAAEPKTQTDPTGLAMRKLRDHGFDPERQGPPDAETARTEIHLRHCPMLEPAREQPEIVCSVHLGLIRGWLEHHPGTQADLQPFAGPGYCSVHIGRSPNGSN